MKNLFAASVGIAFLIVVTLAFSPLAKAQAADTASQSGVDQCVRGAYPLAAGLTKPALRNKLLQDICSVRRPRISASTQGISASIQMRLLTSDAASASQQTGLPRYFITGLGTLGGSQSFAFKLNKQGEVVGFSWLPGDAEGHTFLYKNGTLIDLSPFDPLVPDLGGHLINDSGQIAGGELSNGLFVPAIYDSNSGTASLIGSFGGSDGGFFNGAALSINNNGNAVGTSYVDSTNSHAFLYSNGVMLDIDPFGGVSSAKAINDHNLIVGAASPDLSHCCHAFVYQNGLAKDIDPSAGNFNVSSSAEDVNNQGQVTGSLGTGHGFIYKNGQFTDDIWINGSPDVSPFSINDHGQVVGVAQVPFQTTCNSPRGPVPCTQFRSSAFLYHAGRIAELNNLIPASSGWDLSWASGINNSGQIVGYGMVNDQFRAFLLTPATKRLCLNNGWKKFGFKNQGQCIQYLNTGK